MSVGYVDLHLHLLPGIDDGCKSMDDTLLMARALVSLGFTTAAPSPHNRSEYQSASKDLCASKLVETRTALEGAGIALTLEPNAENYFLDERLFTSLATPDSRRVGTAGKYLLVEAPYTSPLPTLPDLLFRMKLKGVTPLIAHPERCLEFEKKGRAAEAVHAGGVLQLDLGSLIGKYGKPAQKLSLQWLGLGLYGIAATDLHAPVGAEAWVSDAIAALRKAVGAEGLTALLSTNPATILRGEALG